MEKNRIKKPAFEPENFTEERARIRKVMNKLTECKNELSELSEIDLIKFEFGDKPQDNIKAIVQVLFSLGEIYGYVLANDTIEGIFED